jgi:hypothetical protein
MEKHDLAKLESHINAIKSAHSDLGTPDGWDEISRIIHQPGWTTIAETLLVLNALESIASQTRQLVGLKNGVLNGARAVGVGITTRAAGA